jgi:hypothetical protein
MHYTQNSMLCFAFKHRKQRITWSDSRVHELIAVEVIVECHCGRVQSTPFGKLCTSARAKSTLKTVLELVLWNDFQSCHHITPDVTSVIKMPSFQYFLYLWEQKRVTGGYIW